VVEVNGPQTVYLAGQTGVDATGKIAEGFRAQAVQVMENQFEHHQLGSR
jgi:enamine deaminase RidA (YjgF/YER057c/UK114 family)